MTRKKEEGRKEGRQAGRKGGREGGRGRIMIQLFWSYIISKFILIVLTSRNLHLSSCIWYLQPNHTTPAKAREWKRPARKERTTRKARGGETTIEAPAWTPIRQRGFTLISFDVLPDCYMLVWLCYYKEGRPNICSNSQRMWFRELDV